MFILKFLFLATEMNAIEKKQILLGQEGQHWPGCLIGWLQSGLGHGSSSHVIFPEIHIQR